jgi:twinkle protein
MKTFMDFGIQVGGLSGTEVATTCPQCSLKRKNSKAKCLSVNTDKGVWCCHHCDWRGTLKGGEDQPGRKIIQRPHWTAPTAPANNLIEWFAGRGIPPDVLEREGIGLLDAYIPQLDERVPCIAFPYEKSGEVVNIKYRALTHKAFRQVAGAEKILYRQPSIDGAQVIIVEGEIDALSLVAAGLNSVVSVPDGAPAVNTKNYASKFSYLDQMPDPFEGCLKIIIAVDSDDPGRTLEKELSRRLGMERCWLVRWPFNRKDANEVLCKDGVEVLLSAITAAKPCPVQDVIMVADIMDSTLARYYNAPARGLTTGWSEVDRFYTIEPGQLTLVTGMPGHGKSEWLDGLILNLALLHGWRFAICSPENSPVELHMEKLLEKLVGAPFRVGPSDRMTPEEVLTGMNWLQEQVCFIMPEEALTISGLLDRAAILVRRLGIRGLVIDPYNEFDHTRLAGISETEYISATLGAMKRWARKWQVHVWLIAHPTKIYRNEDGSYPVPTPYDVAGSAQFRNKPENCITVWRDERKLELPTQIHVQKVRFKHIGRIGMAELTWDRRTGRYTDVIREGVRP